MVTSLGRPVRDVNYNQTAILHLVGLFCGAMVSSAALIFIGKATASTGRQLICEACLILASAAIISQLGGRRAAQSHWQVPSVWRQTVDPTVLPLAYGALLGMGIWTAVVVSAFWAFVAATPLESPWVAVAGWGIYAAARGVGFLSSPTVCAVDGGARIRRAVVVFSSLLALALALVAIQPL